MIYILFFFLVSFGPCLFSESFVYPSCVIDDQHVFVVRQSSLDQVELFSFNVVTGLASKELVSMFLPSQIKLLPGGDKFSFVDRGRVRVKDFNKRTPRAIDIMEPVGSVFYMSWVNDHSFIFSGRVAQHMNRSLDNYGVFLCDISDDGVGLKKLAFIKGENCLYPAMSDNQLFFVKRDRMSNYCICGCPYAPIDYDSEFDPSVVDCLFSSENPICFLLSTDSEGLYFLDFINSSGLLMFNCYRLDFGSASANKLFDFLIPEEFVLGFGKRRLYESLSPFLPVFSQGSIYFTNYEKSCGAFGIFTYNLNLQSIKRLTDLSSSCFSPVPLSDKCVWFGEVYAGEEESLGQRFLTAQGCEKPTIGSLGSLVLD